MNNPGILVAPSGPQFLTAPDGTTAPDVAGTPVDLTGVPLTAAPSYAFDVGTTASILASTVGVDMTVTNLAPGNLTADLVGKRMQITGAMEGDAGGVLAFAAPYSLLAGLANITADDNGRRIVVTGAVNPANDGTFDIFAVVPPAAVFILNPAGVAPDAGPLKWKIIPRDPLDEGRLADTGNDGSFTILSVIDPITVLLANPNALAVPDPFDGFINWSVLPALTDFPPGDPLSYIARLQIPDLNVNQPAPGPATFGDYNPTLPPLIVNDSSGLFSKVQAT